MVGVVVFSDLLLHAEELPWEVGGIQEEGVEEDE